MAQRFDLIVLGTGSAASAAANRCRAAGWQVAVIDSRPFGGTCALRGCDPKKVLVGASEAVDWMRRMQGNGPDAEQVHLDWAQLMRFKRTFTQPVPVHVEEGFAKAGIVTFHGRARFVGPTSIQVGEDVLEGGRILIATGQKPADLKIPGSDYLTNSEQFLDLDHLPKRVVFIGGGYIAFDFAHVALRAGSHVTIVHQGAHPLEHFDPDLVDQLVEHTRALGADIRLEATVVGVERDQDGLTVRVASSGEEQRIAADLVVHSAGRVAEIDDLNLEAAGVERTPEGIQVNEFLQSVSNEAVYSAGDAADSGGLPLTPVAAYEGILVASNLLQGNNQKPNYLGIPTVVFTTPALAALGCTEREAREQGLNFRVQHAVTTGWYQSRRVGEAVSGYKILIGNDNDRILGAHLLGDGAEENINLFALAMRSGMRASDLKHMLFAYPTHASDIPHML